MEHLHGEVETEAKAIGTEAHEKLTEDSVKVKREQLWQHIYGDKPVFCLEMLLLAKYGDVFLAGKPDSVLFKRGFPRVLFEYKFSKSYVDYLSYHVQAQTYCVLLENMGFDTSKLSYAIVVANPVTRGSRELRQAVVSTVLKSGLKEATHSIDNAKVYLRKFNRANAGKNLDWALGFWSFYSGIQKSTAYVDLHLYLGDQIRSQKAFDYLLAQKDNIEKSVGQKITWERRSLSFSKASRLIIRRTEDSREVLLEAQDARSWIVETLIKLFQTLNPQIPKLQQ